ncbi:hypothetical protein EVG20_g400 [Dentipellis fragilis]|uniref:Uncharacterized protein n=1 Tax=Dentipellis fragilis TaxID=205917 RepID=A0A4Y9ZFR7_9AGAM|nr:hypothetical protein EVG20_g400 [Dentipellis fragilis]
MMNGMKQAEANERYAALQRKLDDLQRIHIEGKKSYQADLERLKGELSRAQKTNGEQAERLDKLKKLKDATEHRMQEVKKTSITDLAEIKDLRSKLRIAENGRAQMSAKQGQVHEAKKALQDLEVKKREELKLRDKQIAELEKSVIIEKTKRESAEMLAQELRDKAEHDLGQVRGRMQKLEIELRDSRLAEGDAISSLQAQEEQTSGREEHFLSQLDNLRTLLQRVAEEYGRLASSTVPSSTHTALKAEHAALQVRTFRLERKLANSEAQVLELASLIRQTKDKNTSLHTLLHATTEEIGFYTSIWQEAVSEAAQLQPPEDSLMAEALSSQHDLERSQTQVRESAACAYEECYRFSRWATRDLLLAYRSCTSDLDQSEFELKQSATNLNAARSRVESMDNELRTTKAEFESHLQQYGELSAALATSNAKTTALTQQLAAAASESQAAAAIHDRTLKKERETVQRLAGTVQRSKMAEEALRAEIDQYVTPLHAGLKILTLVPLVVRLTGELTEAERYQEAYFNLMEQVESLAARNELAEEEAKRLSKFNAEILGHNNPAQRIMYLDRIRSELAEAKQDLLAMTRERDAAAAYSENLQHELDMYKSVAVPPDMKPRTTITRVARIPLATQSANVAPISRSSSIASKHFDPAGDDMTLDEII